MDYTSRVGIHNRTSEDIEKEQKSVRDCIEHVKSIHDNATRLFGKLECPHINSATKKIGYISEDNFKWSELNTRSRALRDAIETELKQYLYYQYPKQKGVKFREWKNEWENVLSSFPEVELDVFSATDCYALEHNIASVFHSMRIAEYGLRALAKERSLSLAKYKPIEWGTWNEIIKALDDEIRVISTTRKAGPVKDAALEFYSGARADLNGLKDEYRNLVMHVRATYDEYQAIRALTKVHAFMERMAAKIDQTNCPIKWEFPA